MPEHLLVEFAWPTEKELITHRDEAPDVWYSIVREFRARPYTPQGRLEGEVFGLLGVEEWPAVRSPLLALLIVLRSKQYMPQPPFWPFGEPLR